MVYWVYMERTMKKIIAALLIATTLTPSIAHADWNRGPRPGYGGGNWAAPLVEIGRAHV